MKIPEAEKSVVFEILLMFIKFWQMTNIFYICLFIELKLFESFNLYIKKCPSTIKVEGQNRVAT